MARMLLLLLYKEGTLLQSSAWVDCHLRPTVTVHTARPIQQSALTTPHHTNTPEGLEGGAAVVQLLLQGLSLVNLRSGQTHL